MTGLPAPGLMLGHSGFPGWYPGQELAFRQVMDWIADPDRRYLCAAIPTGSGKSLLAAMAARASGRRGVVLTATKGLQDQLLRDFYEIGMVDVRGQNNYPCVVDVERQRSADDGPCHSGLHCPHQLQGCPYYDQLRRATASDLVVTNYSYYLAQTTTQHGLGDVPLLILDEADQAFHTIESHFTTTLRRADLEPLGILFPQSPENWTEWKRWAFRAHARLQHLERMAKQEIAAEYGDVKRIPAQAMRSLRMIARAAQRLQVVAASIGDWVWELTPVGYRFVPVWPGEYA